MSHEDRINAAGIVLPPPAKPAGNYRPAVRTGNLLFVSGQGPRLPDGTFGTGVVGQDVSVEDARYHARLCGLAILAAAKQELGTLDSIVRVVKILGLVRGAPDFGEQPKVIDGCSNLFAEVFGENGVGARSAIGAGSLPRGITTEVEAVFEVL
jgi:enamine deaminase RidA (YjgF/YER057c/UK114 family)